MAFGNFDKVLSYTLGEEGGFVNDPRDNGGATNMGITIGTLSQWIHHPASVADVKALTREAVSPIYKGWYWDTVHGDALPPGVDAMVFDFGVTSSPLRSARFLQTALQVTVDGHIGPATLGAAADADASELVTELAERQEAFYRGLADFDHFGKGWLARVERRKAFAETLIPKAAA